MRHNKKGSLSLSINAIVVLVLAISMLGLGLGFTKSMFAKFGSKLDVPAPNIPATEDEPITVESENLQAKIGKSFAFGFNVYNKGTAQASMAALTIAPGATSTTTGLYISCNPPTGASAITVAVAAGTINAQTYAPFKALISTWPANTGSTGQYLCTIYAVTTGGVHTKQITIQYT